ncbi:MAG: YccF domain-containing protein [Clostridia bacterium]|nr:YccF domain-containing protein [Clostridia bacterium]
MRLIGNLLWFALTGLVSALVWFVLGLLWCVTLVGIPFGRQCFKMAGLVLFPFGREIHSDFGKHPFANLIWILLGGLELCIFYLVIGLLWCITIVGIPFGKQCFKLATLSLAPFGASVC